MNLADIRRKAKEQQTLAAGCAAALTLPAEPAPLPVEMPVPTVTLVEPTAVPEEAREVEEAELSEEYAARLYQEALESLNDDFEEEIPAVAVVDTAAMPVYSLEDDFSDLLPEAADPAPEDAEEALCPALQAPTVEEPMEEEIEEEGGALVETPTYEAVLEVEEQRLEPIAVAIPAPVPAAPAQEISVPASRPFAAPSPVTGGDPLSVILKGRELASAGEETVEAVEEAAPLSLELLCFRVGSEEYAISIMDVKEIIRPRELTEVPRTPPFMGGILSLRGIIIPVFDLRVRLGLAQGEHSKKERIVVVKRERGFCGVLVDQVVQVVRLAVSGIEPPPVVLEGIDRDFVQGIGRVDGRMLILLDMDKVLDLTLS